MENYLVCAHRQTATFSPLHQGCVKCAGRFRGSMAWNRKILYNAVAVHPGYVLTKFLRKLSTQMRENIQGITTLWKLKNSGGQEETAHCGAVAWSRCSGAVSWWSIWATITTICHIWLLTPHQFFRVTCGQTHIMGRVPYIVCIETYLWHQRYYALIKVALAQSAVLPPSNGTRSAGTLFHSTSR